MNLSRCNKANQNGQQQVQYNGKDEQDSGFTKGVRIRNHYTVGL